MKCNSVQKNKLIKKIRSVLVVSGDETLVKIKAIVINRTDLLQIEIKYVAPLKVHTTASDLRKLKFLRDKYCILSFNNDFGEVVSKEDKVDLLIIDILGGCYLNQNIKLI